LFDPFHGFFQWRWEDSKGKNKTPHYIFLKKQKIFSVAGLYSAWVDKVTGGERSAYTVLTTKANTLMEGIHNNKKRMPVIIPRDFEKDWLNPSLTRADVLAMCQPLADGLLDACPISKLITSRMESLNVPEVLNRVDSRMLF